MASLGRSTGDLHIDGKKSVQMIGSGLDGAVVDSEGIFSYSSTVGVGARQELDGLYLDFYRQQYKGESCRGVSVATICPWLMMITRSHTA